MIWLMLAFLIAAFVLAVRHLIRKHRRWDDTHNRVLFAKKYDWPDYEPKQRTATGRIPKDPEPQRIPMAVRRNGPKRPDSCLANMDFSEIEKRVADSYSEEK